MEYQVLNHLTKCLSERAPHKVIIALWQKANPGANLQVRFTWEGACGCVCDGREGVVYSGCLDMTVPWWLISLGRNALWRQQAFYSCREIQAEIHKEGQIDREQKKERWIQKKWECFSGSQSVSTTHHSFLVFF